MSAPLLQVRGVSRWFGGLRAVDEVSFDLGSNEIVGLIGPNGAGKTTLFETISGFIRPTRGTVVYDGLDITGQPPHRLARLGIGRTFQIVQPFRDVSVLENVIAGVVGPDRGSANPRAERARDATEQRPAIRAANRDATAAAEAKIDLRAGLLGILNLVELGFAGGRPAEGHGEQACKSYRHAAHLASSLVLRRAL